MDKVPPPNVSVNPNQTKTNVYKLKKAFRDAILFILFVTGIVLFQNRHLLPSDATIDAPAFVLPELDSTNMVSIPSKEKRTLLYFFAPWCHVCAASINNLNGFGESEIEVIRVALDYSSIEEVERFQSRHNVQGTIVLGTMDVREAYQIRGYPTYYIVNEKGSVVAGGMGYSTEIGMRINNFLNNE
ncbi:redoxin family protein [Aestuariibacter sp. AA17]|uniref:Redoxin family protein n=1 Tax=Fluctibacter corallii TaxID=2984329 RepID=A0ABT3A6E6_9ALTE|nr:redoxin family protein [Aestuariibacter sp. AA17]MCV2884241.1 redoxin family protein [Aestuariibacter sp. AA17]